MRTVEEMLAEMRAEKRANILRKGETYHEVDIFCPYCAEEQRDWWESAPDPRDEEGIEMQCDECERHFHAKAEVVFSTRRLK